MAAAQVPPIVQSEETVEKNVAILRSRVDQLELGSKVEQKPWYKQIPLVLSICSLLISTGFSLYTAYEQSVEKQKVELKNKLELLRTTVLQIADVRNEFLQAATLDQNTPQFAAKSSLLNTKKQVLIQAAGTLLAGIEDKVSPGIIAELAYEESADNKLLEAKRDYELALRSPELDLITNMACHRALGELYMQPGSPFYSLALGRAEFDKAHGLLKDQQNDFAYFQSTYLYADQAYFEFINHQTNDGQKKIFEAQNASSSINAASPYRSQAANFIVLSQQQAQPSTYQNPTASAMALLSRFAGKWALRYANAPDITATLLIVINPDGKTGNGNMSAFRGGQLIKKYTGQIFVADAGTIQLEWTGVESKVTVMAPFVPIYGSTSFKMSDADAVVGNEFCLGETSRKVKLSRAKS
jgi:hypothetical protein